MPAKRSPSTAIAALSLGVHAALLAAFVLRPEPPPMAAGVGALISVALVSAPPGPEVAKTPPTEPAPPAAEPEAVEAAAEASVAAAELAQPTPAAEASIAPAPAPTGGGSDLAGCALTGAIHAALQAEAPRAALARIPERRRSVAGAVMLWDGGWVRSGALADARVARPIRDAIVEAVRAAEPACAATPVSGPVLLLVPDAGGAMVLVLGSGTWRWADLAADREASHPTGAGGR